MCNVRLYAYSNIMRVLHFSFETSRTIIHRWPNNIRFKYIHSVRVLKCSLVLNAFVRSFVRFEIVCIQDFDEKYGRGTVTTATASTAIEAVALTMANGDKNLHPHQKG